MHEFIVKHELTAKNTKKYIKEDCARGQRMLS